MIAYAVIAMVVTAVALIGGWVFAFRTADDLTETAAGAVFVVPIAASAGAFWPLALVIGALVAARYVRDHPRPPKPRPLTESEKYDAMARDESRAASAFTRAGQDELAALHRSLAEQYRALAGQARASEGA